MELYESNLCGICKMPINMVTMEYITINVGLGSIEFPGNIYIPIKICEDHSYRFLNAAQRNLHKFFIDSGNAGTLY